MSSAGVWSAVSRQIESSLRRQQFETWFRCITPVEADEERIVLSVPNRFYKEWLETYYLSMIKESATKVTGASPAVTFVIGGTASPRPERPSTEPGTQPAREPAPVAAGAPPAAASEDASHSFSPNYTFDSFVVGPANRLCHAAAMAIVDAPGRAYNPLFIHGGVGLGKTHLLQAGSRAFMARNPNSKLVYISCEQFVNDFVAAVQRGSLAELRSRLREVDFLVIDDIHFLARAERTQEEFFHTFNTLYNARKQIVLSSDSAPTEIPSLEERLVSRFKWGLVARLDPPTYETRVAIVRNKSAARGYELPAGVAEFIAESITANIRELEGALTRVVAFAALSNRAMTLELAREALQDTLVSKPLVSIEDIAREVSSRYSVKLSDLQGRRRTKSIALPRQVCMHLARQMTNYSLKEIGGFFGGRDHTTVMYADDKIAKLVRSDPGVRMAVRDIHKTLTR